MTVRCAWGSLLERSPAAVEERLLAWRHGHLYRLEPVLHAPDAAIRVAFLPVNYAGQGWQWAHSVSQHLPGVAARNLAVRGPRFSFPADLFVSKPTFTGSRSWQAAQREALLGFTHVVIEASYPLFRRLEGEGTAPRVARWLREHGVEVAMLCHGTEVRTPERHLETQDWSPYADPAWAERDRLREVSRRNRDDLAELRREGFPLFVSTPDLLLDVPGSRWCPNTVDIDRWSCAPTTMERAVPQVVRAPSNGVIKGTSAVNAAMGCLAAEGLIEYTHVADISPEYRDADIVIDQLRIGTYSTTACEAMASGRVVVVHVDDQVRGGPRPDRPGTARGRGRSLLVGTSRPRDWFATAPTPGQSRRRAPIRSATSWRERGRGVAARLPDRHERPAGRLVVRR